jgi:DNA-binding IclR family transcriptional regulator
MSSETRVRDPNKSATALRALRVLEVLAAAESPLSAVEVATLIATERSTAYRMLITLMEAGYVVRDPRTRAYRLGHKLLALSRPLLRGDHEAEIIAESLREISARTGETVHYSVWDLDGPVLVQRAKGTQLVTIDFQIGDRAQMHCTSIGKVLLAYQNQAVVEEVIRRGLPKVARNTITDPDRLRAELAKARTQGYAYDDMEFADDMRCVAVAVSGKDESVSGGISISGPGSRFTLHKLRELRDVALDAARRLSLRLSGGVGSVDGFVDPRGKRLHERERSVGPRPQIAARRPGQRQKLSR